MPPKRRNQHENISTHAPLAGRDQEGKQAYGSNEQFQPTRPLRGATDIRLDIRLPQKQFQPTRPLRGATTSFVMSTTISRAISTHAPLAGRDGVVAHIAESPAISTHAPLAGRDAAASSLLPFFFDFNPRAPCGARRQALPRVLGGEGFQPTRPLRGATPGRARSGSRKCQFQPTRPLRGATARHGVPQQGPEEISTHAPLAGRDSGRKSSRPRRKHFNPRAPCGARRAKKERPDGGTSFQPTRPLRGATCTVRAICKATGKFQPTRPLRGATIAPLTNPHKGERFQPTRPLRGATCDGCRWREM